MCALVTGGQTCARPIFAAIAQGYGAAPCPASICTPRSGVPGSTSRLSPWRLESGRSASYDQCEALRAWHLDRLSTCVCSALATLVPSPPTMLNAKVSGKEGNGIAEFPYPGTLVPAHPSAAHLPPPLLRIFQADRTADSQGRVC